MKTKLFNLLLAVAIPTAFACAPAKADVFGIQALTGNILTIDPKTGTVTNTYRTPETISALQGNAGLTYAANLGQLLYFDASKSGTLFRLNPDTGAVVASPSGDTYFTTTAGVVNSGLSYEQVGGANYLYYAHQNVDTHLQVGFGGADSPFFNQPTGTGTPTEGLGGDGYGREFAISSNGIFEYNPTTGDTIHSFALTLVNQAIALGLAFDGTDLYVSTSIGTLLTIDPDTGAQLNSAIVAGGNLIELGARNPNLVVGPGTVPEPESLALLGIGIAAIALVARRRKTGATSGTGSGLVGCAA